MTDDREYPNETLDAIAALDRDDWAPDTIDSEYAALDTWHEPR